MEAERCGGCEFRQEQNKPLHLQRIMTESVGIIKLEGIHKRKVKLPSFERTTKDAKNPNLEAVEASEIRITFRRLTPASLSGMLYRMLCMFHISSCIPAACRSQ